MAVISRDIYICIYPSILYALGKGRMAIISNVTFPFSRSIFWFHWFMSCISVPLNDSRVCRLEKQKKMVFPFLGGGGGAKGFAWRWMIFVVYWGTTNNISSAERKRAKVLLTGRGKGCEVTKPYKDPGWNQKRTWFKEFNVSWNTSNYPSFWWKRCNTWKCFY